MLDPNRSWPTSDLQLCPNSHREQKPYRLGQTGAIRVSQVREWPGGQRRGGDTGSRNVTALSHTARLPEQTSWGSGRREWRYRQSPLFELGPAQFIHRARSHRRLKLLVSHDDAAKAAREEKTYQSEGGKGVSAKFYAKWVYLQLVWKSFFLWSCCKMKCWAKLVLLCSTCRQTSVRALVFSGLYQTKESTATWEQTEVTSSERPPCKLVCERSTYKMADDKRNNGNLL